MEVIEYSTMVNIAKAVKAHVTSLEVSRANLIEMDKLIQRVTNGKVHQQTAANVMALYCYHVAKRLREEEKHFPELISFDDRFDRTLYMFKPDPNVDFAFLLRSKEEKMRVFNKWYYPRMVVLDHIIHGNAKCLIDDVRADWYKRYGKEMATISYVDIARETQPAMTTISYVDIARKDEAKAAMVIIDYANIARIAKRTFGSIHNLTPERRNMNGVCSISRKFARIEVEHKFFITYCYHVARAIDTHDVLFGDRFNNVRFMFDVDNRESRLLAELGEAETLFEKMRCFSEWYAPRVEVLKYILDGHAKALWNDVANDFASNKTLPQGVWLDGLRKDEPLKPTHDDAIKAIQRQVAEYFNSEQFTELNNYLRTTKGKSGRWTSGGSTCPLLEQVRENMSTFDAKARTVERLEAMYKEQREKVERVRASVTGAAKSFVEATTKVREAAEQLNAQYKGIVNFKELERTMQEFAEEKRFLFTTTYKVEEIKPRDVLKSEMESLLNSYNVLKSETEKLLNSENGGDVTSAADDVHLDVEFEDEARPRWNTLHLKHVREVISHALVAPKVCQELTYVWAESTAKHVVPMLNALGFKVEGKAKSPLSSRKYIVTWEAPE